MARVPVVLALTLLAACGARVDAIRSRFARDTTCPEGDVAVQSEGNTRYTVRGCDRSVTYVCESGTGTSADGCSEMRQDTSGGPPPARTSVPGTDPSLPNVEGQ